MEPDLASYDVILVNTSAGKDSQAMLDVIVERCDAASIPRGRIVCVHADLGRVEWDGTAELATFGPNSLYFQHGVPMAEAPTPGCWNWPPKV